MVRRHCSYALACKRQVARLYLNGERLEDSQKSHRAGENDEQPIACGHRRPTRTSVDSQDRMHKALPCNSAHRMFPFASSYRVLCCF